MQKRGGGGGVGGGGVVPGFDSCPEEVVPSSPTFLSSAMHLRCSAARPLHFC